MRPEHRDWRVLLNYTDVHDGEADSFFVYAHDLNEVTEDDAEWLRAAISIASAEG